MGRKKIAPQSRRPADHSVLPFGCACRRLRRVNSPRTQPAYADAGVNVELADTLKAKLKQVLKKTRRPAVLGAIGGFAGLFELVQKKYERPVLVSSIDGVGTKLKIAVAMNKHDTVGQDLVHHCVNDIAVLGAKPLFLLDYIGVNKLASGVFEQLVGGMAKACAESGCALIGGETAQMPDIYQPGDYDLVGCIVGVVEKNRIIDGSRVKPGDAIIGLASSGLHTNGYSLARQILFTRMRVRLDDYSSALGGTFGEELLKIHRNYLPVIYSLQRLNASTLHAAAHITGGGFCENIPRVLPRKCQAVIHAGSWDILPIFEMLQQGGGIGDEEMFCVFNMGIGMVLIVDRKSISTVHRAASKLRTKSYVIGEICHGDRKVQIV
jgi:phosphoribosylformylglycinamidine cyclo-ligase